MSGSVANYAVSLLELREGTGSLQRSKLFYELPVCLFTLHADAKVSATFAKWFCV